MKQRKRIAAFALAAAMVFSTLPLSALAVEPGDTIIGGSGLCEHHTEHTEDCGYTPGIPGTECTHEHDAGCGYFEGTPEIPCDMDCAEVDEVTGAVIHQEGCAYSPAVEGSLCQHEHDEICGYVEEVPGTPCHFVCEICNPQDDGAQEQCSCITLCAEGNNNPDCPVCGAEGADLSACKGKAGQEENCTCTVFCTEDTINTDCPVCGAEDADLTVCKGKAEQEKNCTCTVRCTEDVINSDCPICATEGADLAMCLGMLPTMALATEETGPFQITVNDGNTAETPYTYTTASDEWNPSFLTVNDGADITVSNKDSTQSPTTHIVIAENATVTITLKGVNITGIQEDSHNGETVPSPIDLSSGATLTLILAEGSTNTLTGGAGTSSRGSPGIHVPDDAVLIIQGGGSLSVTGGSYISGYGAPGIGGRTDVSESDPSNFYGENCGTVIILPGGSVNAIGGTGSGGSPAADIGGGRGDPDGDDGQGIKPTGDGAYAVFGDLTLPCDITIPAGATVIIPEGASLTVPAGKTLTNNGTLLVQGGTLSGTVTGNQPAYPSEVTVAFSEDGQSVTSVSYGSTITVTATMKKADSAANALRANTGTVDFYLGAAEGGTKLNDNGVTVTQGSDGTCTAALNVTLDGENWKPSDSPYTITADFGGYIPGGNQGGGSLAPNAGSAQLTVTKAQQAAPTGGFVTTSRTDSSITLHFSVSNQSANKNGLEFAYAAGMTADTPTDIWTAAERIETSKVYVATIENLLPGTPYILFARYKGDDFHEPSPAVASSSVYYTDPKITTDSLPNAYVGELYSCQLEAQVADGIAVRWSISHGSLPAGLTLSADGAISGTPTAATPQAVSITVCAAFGEGADTKESTKTLTISVTKSDAELGNLTVSGNTGSPEGTFQYGDTITVTFTPRRQASAAADTLTPDTAALTYAPADGEEVTLATASAQADGSFILTYDTKQKMLPTKVNLPLTVSYGGSGALNPATKIVTVTLHKGRLRNQPSISGSYTYGETLTVDYTKQDDETVSYQWFRSDPTSDSTSYTYIDGANSPAYTLTEEDIGKQIYVQIMPASDDEWHTGLLRSAPQVVTKATQTAPSAPTAAGTTTYSVTLTAIAANSNGVAAEYGISKDGGKTWTWQSGPEFSGLSSNTTYQFAARYGETDKYMASAPSAPVHIATDRRSSGGGSSGGGSSGSSYRDREYDFWQEVREQIEDANPGDIIKVNARGYDRMSWTVMEALRKSEDITLIIRWNGGEDITIHSTQALKESSRIYYPLSYLESYGFGKLPQPDPSKVNPETGGIHQIDAPVTADIQTPEGKPEVTAPQRGLAESPELAQQEIEKAVPGVYEPEAQLVIDHPTQDESDQGNNILPIALAVILAAGAGAALLFWRKHKAS